jgi:hypothetical protein
MRKLLGVLAAGFIAMGVAGQAHAVNLDFSGTIAIQLATLDPVLIDGSGTAIVNGAGAAGHLTALQVPASPFATNGFVLPVTDPVVFPIAGVQLTAHNAVGNFAGSGGAGFNGEMPINGAAKICLFGTCSAAVSNLSVPLTVVGGPGGSVLVTGAVNLTVIGAPWTTGTAAVGAMTQMGGVSPLSETGALNGKVTLVTPIFVSTNIGASAIVPGFGIMSLQFKTPEPGTLAAFGAAFAALVAVGLSRRR